MTQPSRAEQLWRQAVLKATGKEPFRERFEDLPHFLKQRWFEAAEQEASNAELVHHPDKPEL